MVVSPRVQLSEGPMLMRIVCAIGLYFVTGSRHCPLVVGAKGCCAEPLLVKGGWHGIDRSASVG